MRGRQLLFTALVCACLLSFRAADAAAERVNRVLLVGCDRFVTQNDTTPSSANNVAQMAEVLSGGAMNPAVLVTRRGDISSVEELAALAAETFQGADDDDVSYFYLSTHGIPDAASGGTALLLSDGREEEALTAQALKTIFDAVPGTKVLILDACGSGALIGKGVSTAGENIFTGGAYKILCSSGGAEESWFWTNELGSGSGYFSDALAYGLGVEGNFAADRNRDGTVTLSELKSTLLETYGASTPRVYPEEDDFAVFTYDEDFAGARASHTAMTGISFGDTLLDGEVPEITFSFTMLRQAQVAYQLVQMENGRWDFEHAEIIWDTQESDAVGWGYVSPGWKERTLTLKRRNERGEGYIFLQILTVAGGDADPAAGCVLCIPPLSGNPKLSVRTPETFAPESGEELTFIVRHRYACALTVSVEDAAGNVVRRLLTDEATRAEMLRPAGTSLTWNGRLADGSPAPAGTYRITVSSEIGGERRSAVSADFALE